VLTASDSASFKGPRQPVYFRHDIHAGQYQISCQYCHYSVAVDAEPGIPSMGTCMGCHLIVGGSDSANDLQIQLVRKAWNEKKPIEWVRVHSLARHVHFPAFPAHQGHGAQRLRHLSRRRDPHAAGVQGQQHQQHGMVHQLPSRARRESRLHRMSLLRPSRPFGA
jgi:hypothetical protein